jgi:diguanylate cyclase (GGDEF)-like protein
MRNWTVGRKLAVAFVTLLLFLAGVAFFSVLQINKLQASSEFLRSDGLHKSALAHSAQFSARSQVTALYSLFFLDDREARVPVYGNIDHHKDQLSKALEALRNSDSGGNDSTTFVQVLDARQDFDKSINATGAEIELNPVSAKRLMVSQTVPKLVLLEQRLEELVSMQNHRVEMQIASNGEAGELAKNLIMAFGLLATLIAAISAYAITRSIVRPLSGAIQFANEIAQGRLDSPLPQTGDGELKTLLSALDRMRHGIDAREKRIGMLAYFDTLTGLPNRTKFHLELSETLADSAAKNSEISVMTMNLNRFKNVNDALGYEAGDALLIEVGKRIQAILDGTGGMVARQQADEFSILLALDEARDSKNSALDTANRILTAMSRPIDVAGQPVDVEASIGIAFSPQHGNEADRLLLCADQAMQASKRTNSGPVLYDPTHAKGIKDNLSLFSELRSAVEHDELVLYFQPQLCLKTGSVPRAEVLVRWQHPQRGIVPPDSFIPFAEQTGAIRKISRWVLEHACTQLAAWQLTKQDIGLCVNLSARDLADPSFPEFIDTLLNKYQIPRHLLSLEVTESAAMEDPIQGLQALERLRELGMRLSIDDFGTGYSSLSYLKRLPVEEIKIDKSFVLHMDDDADDDKIVRSTIDLGHIMDLEVIAEGVETEASLQRLRAYGCNFAQGYFVARPMPIDRFESWLAEHQQTQCP